MLPLSTTGLPLCAASACGNYGCASTSVSMVHKQKLLLRTKQASSFRSYRDTATRVAKQQHGQIAKNT
eukprot:3760881-Pleurochrysis_carterae.AAC.2